MKEWVKSHGLLIPFLFIVLFGFGYQAIPLFTCFYLPLVLIYTRDKPWQNIIFIYFVSSMGFALAFLGNFRTTTTPRFPMAWFMFLASFVINLVLIVVLFSERFMRKHNTDMTTRVLFTPLLYTSLWFLIGRLGPLGDYPSLTTVTIGWSEFAQLSSLGGRAFLDFLLALSATVLLELPTFPLHQLSIRTTPHLLQDTHVSEVEHKERSFWLHPVTLYTILMAVLLSYGGMGNIRRGSFYQTIYPDYIPKTERVGCVVGPGDNLGLQLSHDTWFNQSQALVASGAKLILWSELTTIVQEEEAFLNKSKAFARKHGVYLAVTYGLGQPVRENKLVVMTKEGEIGINYNKAHPVPGIELQPAGPNVLQFMDTPEFGRLGGAICFDFNFAHLIGQASDHGIDIMLQPSWTWGPIGTYHGQGNALRPLENGFTLFRCVSQGVSGIFEPTNSVFQQKVASNNVESYLFYLPLVKRIRTLYASIGDLFSYLCILTSGVWMALTLWWHVRHATEEEQIRI
ncbi:carbon-nitrogen hydrolase [Mucor mucedo]|uniref:carbon-nitrogen hydrolase n=1 Tax=Mucor mucedo TaxID=29922 RepID=UPI0022201070|nr:carbon-nitrogen hydrolase [Mucor mucedo]KAI7889834.1 carbon-nitrogen hydrolase [Mucor mucedo]